MNTHRQLEHRLLTPELATLSSQLEETTYFILMITSDIGLSKRTLECSFLSTTSRQWDKQSRCGHCSLKLGKMNPTHAYFSACVDLELQVLLSS